MLPSVLQPKTSIQLSLPPRYTPSLYMYQEPKHITNLVTPGYPLWLVCWG